MTFKVEKRGGGKRPYKIVKQETGETVGSSTNRKDAEISASKRNQATGHERPKGRGGR